MALCHRGHRPKTLEGLRLLPWLQEAARRDPKAIGYLLDCTKCRAQHPRLVRQMMKCGWEAPLDVATLSIRPEAWRHVAYEGDPPSTCAGYACSLPEVIETARARHHWNKGALAAFTRGEMPSENLLRAIEILDGESHRVESWLATPRDKGGGGP